MDRCSNGHPLTEVSRNTLRETVEEVVYSKQKIKHFDRHGSEFWDEIEVPDIVEREVEVIEIAYRCAECGEQKTVRQPGEESSA